MGQRSRDGEKMPAHFAQPALQTGKCQGKFTDSLQTSFVTGRCMEPSITPLIYPCHFPVESRPVSGHWHFLSHPLDEDFI